MDLKKPNTKTTRGQFISPMKWLYIYRKIHSDIIEYLQAQPLVR